MEVGRESPSVVHGLPRVGQSPPGHRHKYYGDHQQLVLVLLMALLVVLVPRVVLAVDTGSTGNLPHLNDVIGPGDHALST